MNPLLLSNKDEYLLKRLATTQIIDKNVPKSKKKISLTIIPSTHD